MCLNLDSKISKKKSGYCLHAHHVQFSHKKLYGELQKIGLEPNKSKSIGALRIPDRYFFDFLRGYFDGDGCVYFKEHFAKDRNKKRPAAYENLPEVR